MQKLVNYLVSAESNIISSLAFMQNAQISLIKLRFFFERDLAKLNSERVMQCPPTNGLALSLSWIISRRLTKPKLWNPLVPIKYLPL